MSTFTLGAGNQTFPDPDAPAVDTSGNDSIYGHEFIFQPDSGYVAVPDDDQIDGGGGNDLIVGDVFTVVLSGFAGGIVSTGDDWLAGGAGDDSIVGDNAYMANGTTSIGHDTLVGGAGNDTLHGGNVDNAENVIDPMDSQDTFVFDFQAGLVDHWTTITVRNPVVEWKETTVTETFDAYLAAHDLSRTGLTQAQFSSSYGDWLNSLVARFHDQGLGQDKNDNGVISVGLQQNSKTGLPSIEGMTTAQVDAFFNDMQSISFKDGKTAQTRSFSNEFSFTRGEWVTTYVEETITVNNPRFEVESGDGHDLVMDFTHGVDKLQLNGITEAVFNAYFTVASDVDGDDDGAADDTVISITGSTEWQVTLADVADFVAHEDIVFQVDTSTQ